MKFLESKILANFNLVIVGIIAVLFTYDSFAAAANPDSYNFSKQDESWVRRSLGNYMISAVALNIVIYSLFYLGFRSINKVKLIRYFNLIVIILYIFFIVGFVKWMQKGFDH